MLDQQLRPNVPGVSNQGSDEPPQDRDPAGREPADGGVATEDTATSAESPGEAGPRRWSSRGPGKLSLGRRFLVNGLIGVATLLLIVGIFSVWANRLLFNPNNWANTSTQLLQNPTIRSATANYAVDQLYANVNVPDLIKSALPPRLDPLAAPAAGALRDPAVQGVDAALQRPRVQDLWANANRAASKSFIAIVNSGKGPVGVKQGVITLNLAAMVDQVASQLGLPKNLGAKLPPHIANLTVLKSNQLKVVQNAGDFLRHLAVWLTVLVPILYALAIVAAPGRRRRTLMAVGFAAITGGLIVIVVRTILVNQVTGSLVKEASLKPAVSEVVTIMTQMLHQIAAACIFVGVPLVIAAWFAGPARPAYATRRAVAPFLRDRPATAYGITLGVMALIFIWDPIHATGTPAGIITFTLIALFGMFMLRRQTMHEFPDARPGETAARVRAWMDRRRQRRSGNEAPAATSESLAEQIRELSDLRDHGAITPDEYQAAKAQLLRG
jgi:predicted anti-sigma-YlaC factor YlaD